MPKDSSLKVTELEPDARIKASVGAARTAVLVHKDNTKLKEAVDTIVGKMQADGSLAKAVDDAGLPSSAVDVKTAG